MYVYYLSNMNNPKTPFYIGISIKPEQRFKQHKSKWQKHKPYIKNKNELKMTILCDTGNNTYSESLAEKIETGLIKYYNTMNYGSNKAYDIKHELKNHSLIKNMDLPLEERLIKASETRRKKKHKHFKKLIKIIQEDPLSFTVEDIIKKSPFKTKNALNKYTETYHNNSFEEWFEQYKHYWLLSHNLIRFKL